MGLHHVALAFQWIYGCSDEGSEDEERRGVRFIGGGERMEITWPLVYIYMVSRRRT